MRRYLLVAAGVLLVLAALIGVKVAQISSLMAYGEEMQAAGPPPEAVGSARALAQAWQVTIPAIGTVAGKRTAAVSSESPGIVRRILFESGQMAQAGQALVELDADVEQGQLASAEARLRLAELTARRTRNLVARGALSRAQLDNDLAQLATVQAEVESLRGQVDRKVVRAPFAGRLGVRAVDVGEYLAPGTVVTELDAPGAVFVDFTLPQERFADVRTGMSVEITRRGGAPMTGTIAAVDPTLDPATRSVQVRAALPNQRDDLRPGMFVDVAVVAPRRATVVAVPATAIVHASYGDSVFVIEQRGDAKIARQQFVRTGQTRGDFVAVLDGVTAGEEVVTAGAFKLRNGSAVTVDNSIQPVPRLDPRPENR